MNVLAFETRWAKNKVSDISWYIFIQLSNLKYFNYMCYKHIWKIRPYKTHFLSWNYSASLQYNILSYIYIDSFPISPFTPKLEKQGFIILTLVIWGKTLLSVILPAPYISGEKTRSYFLQLDKDFHIFFRNAFRVWSQRLECSSLHK